MRISIQIPFSSKPAAQVSGWKGTVALTQRLFWRFSVAVRAAGGSVLFWLWASRDHWPEAAGMAASACSQHQHGALLPQRPAPYLPEGPRSDCWAGTC